jgi:ketosteroid isomerase-like protein
MRILRTFAFALATILVSAAHAETSANDPFLSFLESVDAAQLALQNGKAEPFKALWSHADDITLAGGFGGTVEKGWSSISKRLDWVASQFSNGQHRQERIVTATSGDLGYVVQLEHINFRVPGQEADTKRDYRVTMIFRREGARWRIVHRHADAQMQKQAPR